MKYIRTKDNIYEVREKFAKGYYNIWGNPIFENDVIAKSDTIEELCDEFVYKNRLYNKFIGKVKGCNGKDYIRLENKDGFEEDNINVGTTNWVKIKGAIWTDKGLIYKAKMKGVLPNGEIIWELL